MPASPRPRVLAQQRSFLSLDPASRRVVYDLLAPSDLQNLAQVSCSLDIDVSDYWAHLVKAMCARFVPNPSQLLLAMGSFRTVFSGSAVLAVITRASWRPGDLDVYCPEGLFLGLVYHFALIQGFQLQNPEVLKWDVTDEVYGTYVAEADDYLDPRQILRVAHMRRGEIDIDIVQSASDSALSPLAAFWTTAVQNFISPTMVCVAYPSFTENNASLLAPRHLIDLQFPPPRVVDLVRKYEGRNFRFAVRPYALTGHTTCDGMLSAGCPTAVRFFGDEHCVIGLTKSLRERASMDAMALLRDDNVFWWRGGYTCGLDCGAIGTRVWPGMLIPTEERDDELD